MDRLSRRALLSKAAIGAPLLVIGGTLALPKGIWAQGKKKDALGEQIQAEMAKTLREAGAFAKGNRRLRPDHLRSFAVSLRMGATHHEDLNVDAALRTSITNIVADRGRDALLASAQQDTSGLGKEKNWKQQQGIDDGIPDSHYRPASADDFNTTLTAILNGTNSEPVKMRALAAALDRSADRLALNAPGVDGAFIVRAQYDGECMMYNALINMWRTEAWYWELAGYAAVATLNEEYAAFCASMWLFCEYEIGLLDLISWYYYSC